jgi:hypothetical protein
MEIIYGKLGKNTYLVTITIFCIGLLFACTNIFSESFAQTFPLTSLFKTCKEFDDANPDCQSVARVYVLIYAVIVTVISLMEYKEQVWVQKTMTFLRFMMFSLIFMTALVQVTMPVGEGIFGNTNNSKGLPDFAHVEKFPTMFANLLLAAGFHNVVPKVNQHLIKKRQAMSVYRYVILTLFYLLSFLGLIVASAFGTNIKPLCSLNWYQFTGNSDPENPEWWSYPIKYVIVLFPALDVITVFPMTVINLADNLLCILKYQSPDHAPAKYRKGMRILVLVIPLVGSLFLTDLRELFNWSGMLGMVPVFFAPTILEMATLKLVPKACIYDGILSNLTGARVLFGFTCVSFVLMFLSNLKLF